MTLRPGCGRRVTATVTAVQTRCLVNTLVPFSTRLADDGLVHVRAWTTDQGPLVLIAEMDWAMAVADRSDAYSGPGIFTYPGYAIPAGLSVCHAPALADPEVIVRMPAPPGERFDRVVDLEDPQGWERIPADALLARLGADHWPGPPTGTYVPRVVREWIRSGALPLHDT